MIAAERAADVFVAVLKVTKTSCRSTNFAYSSVRNNKRERGSMLLVRCSKCDRQGYNSIARREIV